MQQKKLKKTLSIKNFKILKTIGQGSYSRVKLVKDHLGGNCNYSCVKIMKKYILKKENQVDHIFNQFQILNQIQHPFLINFQGLDQDSKNVYFFFQYVPGGQLYTYLENVQILKPQQVTFYSAQIIEAIQYLHQNDIVYRDLKPQNILLSTDGYLKLTDFGLSKIINHDKRTFTLCGTPQYMAPEVLLNKGHGKSVDWWALGVLIYEMLAGIDPFSDDQSPMNVISNIIKGKFSFPKNFDKNARSLIKNLLTADLSRRYGNLKNGVEDIKSHKFFDNINYKFLITKKIQPPYKPSIKYPGDTSNFYQIQDSKAQKIGIKFQDQFGDW